MAKRWLRWDGVYWLDEGACNQLGGGARAAAPPTALAVQRLRDKARRVSANLNLPNYLALKIVSVPESFTPFKQDCWIEVDFTGIHLVRQCLLRIYRNSPLESDLPLEDLVYQEVIDGDRLLSLPKKQPKKQNKSAVAKADVTERTKKGFFRGYARGGEAPYKVKIWVSTLEAPFRHCRFTPEQRDSITSRCGKEMARIKEGGGGYDASGLSGEEKQRILDAFAHEGYDVKDFQNVYDGLRASFNPKEIRGSQVHDQTGDIITEPPEFGKPLDRWSQIANSDADFRSGKWTGPDGAGVNLMFQRCNQHVDFRPILEIFPAAFEGDPVGIYQDLFSRRDAAGNSNFPFPELAEFLYNIERHVRLIEKSFCCGEYSLLPHEIRDQITPVMRRIRADQRRILSAKCPYKEVLIFAQAFVCVVEWVHYHGYIEPECWFHELQSTGLNRCLELNEKRNLIEFRVVGARSGATDELPAPGESPIPDFSRNPDLMKLYETAITLDREPTERLGPFFGGYFKHKMLRKIINSTEIVMLPSYNPLSEEVFCNIRCVPMYFLGVIDTVSITADRIRMTPAKFWEHDCFHVVDFPDAQNRQQHRQLKARFDHLLDNPPAQPFTAMDVYSGWKRRADQVVAEVMRIKDADERKMVMRILFCALHEPVTRTTVPCVPEFSPLVDRLCNETFVNGIVRRCQNRFFGDVWGTPAEVKNAVNTLLAIIALPDLLDDISDWPNGSIV